MFGKVDHVIIFVKDMKRATAFYRDILGFNIVNESPYFTMVQTENIWLGLHPTEDDGKDIGGGPLIYFNVNNMDDVLGHFSKNSVKTSYSQDVPSGKIQTFYDSEGNALGVYAKTKDM